MANRINWFEIPTSDIRRAISFYEAVLQVQLSLQDMDVLKMAVIPSEDGGLTGALVQHPEFYFPHENAGPLLYLNGNPDLQAYLDRAEQAGGKVLIPKRMIAPGMGYMAVIQDSEGNRIAFQSAN